MTPGDDGKQRDLAYDRSVAAAFGASAVVVAGQTWLALDLRFQPFWLLPLVSAGLLVASLILYVLRRRGSTSPSSVFPLVVVGSLALVNALCLVLLVRGIFVGSALDATGLLLAGVVLWIVNVAVFALAYWEVDRGGPESRSDGSGGFPDLVFPQEQDDQDGLRPADWTPHFYDYLYVSVTASTAFSPTDAMPYSGRAKLLMGLESTISFAIVGMLVARAVNIAKG